MDLFGQLAGGLSTALQPTNLLYCLIGTFLGTVIGVLPGVGPLATIAMLLPITFGLDPTSSCIMLAGIYYGSQYGGSTTSILLNLPGESSSAITTIDGYQMAVRGRAGPALAAAGISSFIAGTLATMLIALIATPLAGVATRFASAEYFSLLVAGLVLSIVLASGSLLKAVGMIVLGLLLGLTGMDLYTGAQRFMWGFRELLDGLSFVALAVGMFGVAEILRNLDGSRPEGSLAIRKVGRLWPSWRDLARIIAPALRGTMVGSFLGILPGGGALLASFVAYNLEKKVSRNGAEFGHGAIEGVAAPESANNAAAQTAFVPMLTLGVPSNAVMALILGALIVQGVTPGPNVITRNPDLFWGLVASMWVGNAMLVILNLPLIGLWTSLLRVPYDLLFPAIVVFGCIGVYSVDLSTFQVWQITLSGVVGYFLVRMGCELPPFILGLILGPLLEEHLRRAMIVSNGDVSVFFTRPISLALLIVAFGLLIAVSLPLLSKHRKEVFPEDDS